MGHGQRELCMRDRVMSRSLGFLVLLRDWPRYSTWVPRLRRNPGHVANHDQMTRERLAMVEEQLKALPRENDRLRKKNHHLIGAPVGFGQLAERLNTALQVERRIGATDRRGLRRTEPDERRRQGT